MKYDVNDSQSNDSDMSDDSQSSMSSGADYMGSMSNSRISPRTLASLDGLNSGVPTRTTATLTPTTLRSIEQTFIELQCQAEQHTNQAGFVPPPVAPNSLGLQQSIGFTGGSLRVSPGPGSQGSSSGGSSGDGDSARSDSPAPPPRRRGMGGRRPAHPPPHMSREEEDRRTVRRERNKMAAARCRKRRLDHTNELVEETEGLQRKKQSLEAEIRQLQMDREELEFILDTHRSSCRLGRRENSPPDVKPVFQAMMLEKRADMVFSMDPQEDVRVKVERVETPVNLDSDVFTSPHKRVMLSSANPQVIAPTSMALAKPNRPNFLNVPLTLSPAQAHLLKNNPNMNEVAGIAITTPSNGIPFNFDSLMEGGTGLTPVQPCATQQRAMPEVGSPDAVGSSKLVSL